MGPFKGFISPSVLGSDIYKQLHLDSSRKEIRVLAISNGSWKAQLECFLSKTSLNVSPTYRCLSYTWGDPNDEKTQILLNGQPFMVTKNLAQALRRIR